jgi:hypothetical protein
MVFYMLYMQCNRVQLPNQAINAWGRIASSAPPTTKFRQTRAHALSEPEESCAMYLPQNTTVFGLNEYSNRVPHKVQTELQYIGPSILLPDDALNVMDVQKLLSARG